LCLSILPEITIDPKKKLTMSSPRYGAAHVTVNNDDSHTLSQTKEYNKKRVVGIFICFIITISVLWYCTKPLVVISSGPLSLSSFHSRLFAPEHPVVIQNIHNVRALGSRLKVVKTYRDRSVYVVDGENVRHYIPDWSTFLTLGYDVGDIVTLTDEAMEALKLGDPLDSIKEEPTPPNPYAGCPCISQNQFLLSVKKKEEANATNGDASTERLSASESGSNIEHHHICLVDNANTQHFLSLYSSLSLHKVSANSMTFSKIPANYTQTSYQKLTTKVDDLRHCDAVMEFTKKPDLYKYTCPEQCHPVPYTLISLAWLEEEAFVQKTAAAESVKKLSIDIPLTCSMTWRQLFEEGSALHRHHNHKEHDHGNSHRLTSSDASTENLSHHHMSISIILKAIVRRRVEECSEREYWPTSAANRGAGSLGLDASRSYSAISKRPVHGFIIWVGSRTRYTLMEDQIQILTHTTKFSRESSFQQSTQNGNGNQHNSETVHEDLIAGWLASEDQYGCRVGSTVCEGVTSSSAYYHYMPTTRMNVASAGWSCAQRRPLRALSHTLLLYDMNYLMIVDDDTYVSVNILLSSPFKTYVRKHLMKEPSIVGQLTHGKKVTRRGFYWGGSGYLIGKAVIDRLNAFEIEGPREVMSVMIDPTMMRDLSVFNQVFPMSQQYCAGCLSLRSSNTSTPPLPDTSVLNSKPDSVTSYVGLQATSKVRLAEICVNLMAQEHTCYHSDHSLSRCFIHGAYAYPLDAECGGSTFPSGLFMGMCMGVGECQTKTLLTCHRWRPYHADYTRAYGYYNVNNETLADQAIPRNITFPGDEVFYERRALRGQ
jgi:hypothetical protein